MKNILIIYLLIFIGLVACRNQEKTPYIIIDLENSINNDESASITLDNIAELVRIIPTETNDSTLLSHIGIAGVTKNHIIVYDKNSVCFINKEDGKISSRFSKQGRGPGEYEIILNTTINERDSIIYLFDPALRNLNIYAFNGNFIKSVQNDSIGGHRELDDGHFAVCFSPYSKTDKSLGIYDKSWNLKRTGIPRMKDQKFAIYPFDVIDKFNGKYYYRAAFSDTVYQITSEHENPYLLISKGKYKIPTEIIASLDKMNKEGYKYVWEDYGLLAAKYFFYTYLYNRKLYRDIWDTETCSLLYRSEYGSGRGIDGIPISIKGIQMNVWPNYVSDDVLYCVIGAEDARRIIPSLPEDTNPVILEFKMKK